MTVEVDKLHYEELLEASLMLGALEEAGVDNWEGYSYAMELLEKMKDANNLN